MVAVRSFDYFKGGQAYLLLLAHIQPSRGKCLDENFNFKLLFQAVIKDLDKQMNLKSLDFNVTKYLKKG